jgi:hypothetical protein
MLHLKLPITSSEVKALDGLLTESASQAMFTGFSVIKAERSLTSLRNNLWEINLTILSPEEVASLLKDHLGEHKS